MLIAAKGHGIKHTSRGLASVRPLHSDKYTKQGLQACVMRHDIRSRPTVQGSVPIKLRAAKRDQIKHTVGPIGNSAAVTSTQV